MSREQRTIGTDWELMFSAFTWTDNGCSVHSPSSSQWHAAFNLLEFENIGLCCFVQICPWRHHFIKLSEREVMVFTWLVEPFFWWVMIKGPSCVIVSGALGFWAVCALQKQTWFECNHLCWFQEHLMITTDHEQAACLWQNDILFCH